MSLSTLIPGTSTPTFWRDQQIREASEGGVRGGRAVHTLCPWVKDTPHSPQPHGGWWSSTKAADGCFSFTPGDVGPTNGYRPFYRPRLHLPGFMVTLLHWIKPLQGEDAAWQLEHRQLGRGCLGSQRPGRPQSLKGTASLPNQKTMQERGPPCSTPCLAVHPLGELSVSLLPRLPARAQGPRCIHRRDVGVCVCGGS